MRCLIVGHSYVRDMSLLNFNHINKDSQKNTINYLYEPEATFLTYLENPDWIKSIVNQNPPIIIVILGDNNLKKDVKLQTIYQQCSEFYNTLRKELPEAYIIASQIEHRPIEIVNNHQSPLADEFSRLVNYFNRWLTNKKFKNRLLCIKGALTNSDLYKWDCVHLNSQGLEILRHIIEQVLIDTVKNKLMTNLTCLFNSRKYLRKTVTENITSWILFIFY